MKRLAKHSLGIDVGPADIVQERALALVVGSVPTGLKQTLIVGNVPTGLKDLEPTCQLQLDIDVGSTDIVRNVRQPSLLAMFQLDSRIVKRPANSRRA